MQILARIYALAGDSLGLQSSSFSLDTRLDSLGIDSLALAKLIFRIEDDFQIALSQERGALQTVGDLVQFVEEATVAKGRGI